MKKMADGTKDHPLEQAAPVGPVPLRAVELLFVDDESAGRVVPANGADTGATEHSETDDPGVAAHLQAMDGRLQRLEALLDRLVQQRVIKDWYSTAEVAQLLGKAEFTVREWCRLARVNARKRACGRGQTQEWVISHTELERIRNEGLLPQPGVSTRIR
jgi:hypothetical protein